MLQKTKRPLDLAITIVWAILLSAVLLGNSAQAAMVLTHTEFAMPDGISQPRSIIEGADGNMWFWAQRTGGQAYGKITPDGSITTFNAPGIIATLHAVDHDGNIWFTDAAGDVYGYIEPDGTLQTFNRPFDSLPGSIVVDEAGNVWIAERAGRILFIASGQSAVTFTPTINPVKLVLGPDGKVWYNGIGSNKIFSIEPNGISTEVIDLSSHGFASNQIIGIDPIDGNVLANVNPPTGEIVKIGTSGIISSYNALQNDGISLSPFAIAKGPNNRLWYAGSSGSTNGYGYIDAGWNFVTMNTDKSIQSLAAQCDRLWYASSNTNVVGYISGIVDNMDCPWTPEGGGGSSGGGTGGAGAETENTVLPPSTGYAQSGMNNALILLCVMLSFAMTGIGTYAYARYIHKR